MKLQVFIRITFLTLLFSIYAFPQTDNVKYTQMTETEKLRFIENRSNEFLGLFRTVGTYQIDDEGTKAVKQFVDSYVRRNSTKKTPSSKCSFGDDLATVLKRGKLYAPDIKSAFIEKEFPAQVGLYIAMIESEFCPCLQAPTGTLGMFQFVATTGSMYGINTVRGATPQKPDDRCKVKSAATGGAAYFKKLADMDFGNNAIGIPFAISAYNSGEGMMKKLVRISNLNKNDTFTYWEMRKFDFNSLPEDEMNKGAINQFQMESSKYFPKFLAAMIIGENPKTFGIEMNPLSQN
ncbi:MAG: transglycosylase SLT domain-containing protein [Acidobacteriota bacterium]